MTRMALRRTIPLGVFAAVFTLLLAACSGAPEATTSSSAPASTAAAPNEPVSGGTVRIGLIQDSQGLDPALTTETQAFIIDSMIYETLLTFDDSGNLAPGLATEWETSDDGLSVTMTVREGVTF
ncbi:MAG: hypothetical protein ACK5KO_12130, partial [Arachnia sp.]